MASDDRDRVPIPADVDQPDRILAGLTARQLAILAGIGVGLWLAYLLVHAVVPLPVFAVAAIPLMAAASVLALAKRDGLSMDRFLIAAAEFARHPRRMTTAPGGVPALPAWVAPDTAPLPAPLRLPLRAIGDDGVIDLGPDGAAVILECASVNFALRTRAEQAALVEAFARYLHSITEPIQILVRAQRLSLAEQIDALRQAAPALPHPALERAAVDYAAFLEELDTSRELLARQILLVIRAPRTEHASETPGRVALRAGERAARQLAAAGIDATVLDGPAVYCVLASAADPLAPSLEGRIATPGQVITSPEVTQQ